MFRWYEKKVSILPSKSWKIKVENKASIPLCKSWKTKVEKKASIPPM